ncbi:beta-ketoacyl synthase chain length factor [Cupriavidus sp. TMH.W2]|uniref:beta-ketoacyl synthase chain length factor n=1 Tax=Cupriavidus sp. TMH.W2 TaxID=3434465 RepID=UPI003D77F8C0
MTAGIGKENGGVALAFGIRAWSAWADGLQAQHDWRAWSAEPHLPAPVAQAPALPAMAAMLRRRLPLLGRVALASAYACAVGEAEHAEVPAVFASRHGDTSRLVAMLTELAAAEPLSPTAFGLAVHNATGAVRSIDLADMNNLQSLSAGRDTVETAVLEACSLLADGAPEVLLVNYDAPVAAPYAAFEDEPGSLYSWCWRLGAPRAGEPWYTLTLSDEPAGAPAPQLPHGLDVLRFVVAGDTRLRYRGERATWQWQRHG